MGMAYWVCFMFVMYCMLVYGSVSKKEREMFRRKEKKERKKEKEERKEKGCKVNLVACFHSYIDRNYKRKYL